MKDERLAMRADAAMLAKLDSFRRAHPDLPSRSEAVRILVDLGIETWAARNDPRSPVQPVDASAAAEAAPEAPTASRKRPSGPRKAAAFDRTAYQREYMQKRRAAKQAGKIEGTAMSEAEFSASPIGAYVAARKV